MIRKIIEIDEKKCNGCGACATACQEGAIEIVNGKAKLMRDDYCDGLGNCLPICPTDAIHFIEREAAAYDEEAVKAKQEEIKESADGENSMEQKKVCGCPGSASRTIHRNPSNSVQEGNCGKIESELKQWPVQIKLAPVRASYFNGANLLIAADCSAYAYADFHREFIHDRITLIGCPKLDMVDYTEKLTEIISNNDIKSVTVVRMEVPCCGGIEMAVKTALQNSGKFIPWQIVTITTDGKKL